MTQFWDTVFLNMHQHNDELLEWFSKEKCWEVILFRFFGNYRWCTLATATDGPVSLHPKSTTELKHSYSYAWILLFSFLDVFVSFTSHLHCGLWIPEHNWGQRHFLGCMMTKHLLERRFFFGRARWHGPQTPGMRTETRSLYMLCRMCEVSRFLATLVTSSVQSLKASCWKGKTWSHHLGGQNIPTIGGFPTNQPLWIAEAMFPELRVIPCMVLLRKQPTWDLEAMKTTKSSIQELHPISERQELVEQSKEWSWNFMTDRGPPSLVMAFSLNFFCRFDMFFCFWRNTF